MCFGRRANWINRFWKGMTGGVLLFRNLLLSAPFFRKLSGTRLLAAVQACEAPGGIFYRAGVRAPARIKRGDARRPAR
jgi:hypothetical protein